MCWIFADGIKTSGLLLYESSRWLTYCRDMKVPVNRTNGVVSFMIYIHFYVYYGWILWGDRLRRKCYVENKPTENRSNNGRVQS